MNRTQIYEEVGTYGISIKGLPYKFYTLVDCRDGTLAWMPDSEEQHVNPQESNGNPIPIANAGKEECARIVQEILQIKTKMGVPLERILTEFDEIIRQMSLDFQSYYFFSLKSKIFD